MLFLDRLLCASGLWIDVQRQRGGVTSNVYGVLTSSF